MARLYDSRKRVLVTGGAGFLGSHLIDRLLREGHEVLCVDNLFTGTKRNMEHFHSNPRFEFFRHDVTFPLYVEADEIYNLPARPHQSIIGMIRCRPQRRRCTAPSTCWVSPSALVAVFFRPQPARSTAIRLSTRSQSPTGATSIRSGRAPATTRASVARKRYFSTIIGSMVLKSRWHESSIRMARACTRRTEESSQISLFRHLPVRR